MNLKRVNAILRDAYVSETMLETYVEQRERQRELMLSAMAARERCPDDPVVAFLAANAATQADIIDDTIASLERGLAKRPEGGWLAALDRENE